MAGKPPMAVGTHGTVRVREVRPKVFRAYTYCRDADGVRRLVARTGTSKAHATRELNKALLSRPGASTGTLTPDSRFGVAAELWFEGIEAAVEAGDRSPTTGDRYRGFLDRHVLPALGSLRLREVTTGRVDAVLVAIARNTGGPTAKSCRTVISGVLGYAGRCDAVTGNAARNTTPISTKPKRKPRALTAEECGSWLKQLLADEEAVRKDLVDLTEFLMATGVRIGEALAVAWEDVDLGAAQVTVDWNIVRAKGRGLIRKSTKSDAGSRKLWLPDFAVEMLQARKSYAESDVVFPNSKGTWRDPSNTSRDLREARGSEDFAWVTSHVFRKTAATILDDEGLTARQIADQLGHARPSMTQDVYMGRDAADPRAAGVLGRVLGPAISHA